MNPVEITQGKSFKGLSQYLLYDQSEAEEISRPISNRVGWQQTYNLADTPPEDAWRMMLATANSANDLKEASGIKKGKKAVKVVHHYSINFNPDDVVTSEIMEKAVAESLEVYDMAHHQVLAVEHMDTDHRHIHVMVNLIDPENGMSAATPMEIEGTMNARTGKPQKRSKLSNSQRKLSTWAKKFERENDLTFTEGRLANANKRMQGEKVNAKRKSRNVYEREKEEKNLDRRRDHVKRHHNNRAKEIQEQTNKLKEKSNTEWSALKGAYYSQKDAIQAQMSPALKERSAEIKTLFKPYWADMFKRHREEVKAFESGDRTTIGKIWHGAAAFKERALDGDYLGGFVAAFSKENRRNIVLKKHDRETLEMRRREQAQRDTEISRVKADFNNSFTRARETFLEDCSKLKSSQDASWADIREAWQEYNNARSAAVVKAKGRGQQIQQTRTQGRGRGRSIT